MEKRFDVYGLGNGILDVLVSINDTQFSELGFEKGTMHLVDVAEQQQLIEKFKAARPHLASGGSVANSIITAAQLGSKNAFACTLGDDPHGVFYKSEFDTLGIELGNPLVANETTGTCVVLVTPDAERTMRTSLGVSASFSERDVSEEVISLSKWIFIEGYLFSNPDSGQAAIRKALDLAKKHDTKVAITFSEAWVVTSFRDAVEDAVSKADFIFANEGEAKAFTSTDSVDEAFTRLAERVSGVAVTAGAKGAYIAFGQDRVHVDAFPATLKDLTGAGDTFAGTLLHGLIREKLAPQVAGRKACYMASKVIAQVGPRLHTGVPEYWNEV